MEDSNIAWCDHTFNPWVGCQKVSAGCANCYAETLIDGRWKQGKWGDVERRASRDWSGPRKWQKKAKAEGRRPRVFCGSLCDVFEDRPELAPIRNRLFELIADTPDLDWLLLTKRPENFARFLPYEKGGWPNVWLGVSIEDQQAAWRADILRTTPAAIRFISYEPALGPLYWPGLLDGIHWLIYGGESGLTRRPDEEWWARSAELACRAAGAAFFFKQRSARSPGQGDLCGRLPRGFPR